MTSRENSFMQEFTFQPRTGRINWNWIMPLDVDRIIHENDVEAIQRLMEHVTYACIKPEDTRKATDEGIIKLVTLLQLCVDYVCSMCARDQELLHSLTTKIETGRLEAGGQRRPPRRKTLSRERDKARGQCVTECQFCGKRFKDQQYLHQHMQRRHPDCYRRINIIKAPAAMEEGRPYVQDESNHSHFQPEPSPMPSPAGQAYLQHFPVAEGLHRTAALGAHDPARAPPLTIDPRSISNSTSEQVLVTTPPIDNDTLERRIQSHIESGRQVLLDEFRVLVQSHIESDRKILIDEVRELRGKHAPPPAAQPLLSAPASGAPQPPPVDTEGLERRLQSHIDLVESNQERLLGLIKQELSNASKAPVQSPVGIAPSSDAIQLQTALLEQMQNQTEFLRQQQTTMAAATKLIVEQPRHAHSGAPPLAAPASSPRRAAKDRERRHSSDRRAPSSERRPPSSERRSSSERRQTSSQTLGAAGAGVGSMLASSPPKKMKMHDGAVKSTRRSQSREKESRRSRPKANEPPVKEPDSDSEHSDSEHSDRGQEEQPKKKRSWFSRLRPSRAEKPKEEEKPKDADDDDEDEEEDKKTKEEEEEEVRKEEDEKTMRVVATGIANFLTQCRRGPPPLGTESAQHASPRSSWSSKAAHQPFNRGGGGAAEATRTQPSRYGGMSDGGGISPVGGPNLHDDMDMEEVSSQRSGDLWGSAPGRGHKAPAPAGFGDAREVRQFSRPPAVQTSFGSRPLQDLSVGSISDSGG